MPSSTIDIKTPDGICDSYIAAPAKGPSPAVLFYMDGIGIRTVLHRMADRIAAAGYVVLLPNMFYRYGRAPVFDSKTILLPENRPKLMEMVFSITPERLLSDAKVFLDTLAAHKDVKPGGKVGATGYCMGGAMVMRTAAAFPDRIAAGACFHGGGLAADDPSSPHKHADTIKAELYFGHADEDPHMTAEQIAKLDAALTGAGVSYTSELYKGALHGYTMTDLPVYNAAAADKHWERLLSLFARTLH